MERSALNRSSSLLHTFDNEKDTYQELGQGERAAEPERDPDAVPAAEEAEDDDLKAGMHRNKPQDPFIDSLTARTFVGLVIVIDLVCLGAEADYPGNYWGTIEVLLVLFYCAEFLVRVNVFGLQMFVPSALVLRKGFTTPVPTVVLNYFRLLLIILGFVDCYVWAAGLSDWRSCFMYLRLLRVIRIFNLFDVLTRFVVALLYMTQNLSWIFCVIALVSYVSAVFFTLYTKDHDLEDAHKFFPDVWTSAFSLFQVTTMDNWHAIAVPLVKYHGGWGVFFVVFIAFTSWTMISLLTAVVSEQIILATRDMKVRETQELERRHKDFVQFLRRCFQKFDKDGNGVLDKAEFTSLIQEDIVNHKMEELGVIIQHEELQDTFDMLDVDESGELTIDEFTVGLSQLQQSLGIKHVLSINYAIQRIHRKLQKQLQSHTTETCIKFEELNRKLDSLGEKVVSRDDLDVKVERLDKKLNALGDLLSKGQQGWRSPRI